MMSLLSEDQFYPLVKCQGGRKAGKTNHLFTRKRLAGSLKKSLHSVHEKKLHHRRFLRNALRCLMIFLHFSITTIIPAENVARSQSDVDAAWKKPGNPPKDCLLRPPGAFKEIENAHRRATKSRQRRQKNYGYCANSNFAKFVTGKVLLHLNVLNLWVDSSKFSWKGFFSLGIFGAVLPLDFMQRMPAENQQRQSFSSNIGAFSKAYLIK